MNPDAVEALLLRDNQGQYYLISREILQQCRVPEDRVAVLEQQLGSNEVSGYSARSSLTFSFGEWYQGVNPDPNGNVAGFGFYAPMFESPANVVNSGPPQAAPRTAINRFH